MQYPHDQPLGILPIQRVEYRYEPSYRLAETLSRIPKRVKRVAIEVSANGFPAAKLFALLSFTLSTVLASQSDELRRFLANKIPIGGRLSTSIIGCLRRLWQNLPLPGGTFFLRKLLKGFRAYFLLTAKDCVAIGVGGLSLYRLLRGVNEKG